MRIRTIFVGVDAHIDPCGRHISFLRDPASKLVVPHGRTESSAPTGRYAGPPTVRAGLQLHIAGSMWASTPTDVMRGRRLLCNFDGTPCRTDRGVRPYRQSVLQFVIIRTNVLKVSVLHAEAFGDRAELGEAEALVEVTGVEVRRHDGVELQDAEAVRLCLPQTI